MQPHRDRMEVTKGEGNYVVYKMIFMDSRALRNRNIAPKQKHSSETET